MTAEHLLQKADVVRLLLETEGRVMLCLDASHPGVAVPRRFSSDNGLRLVLNRNMPQPIDIGPLTIESELRFGGIPHYCVIPYEAVWGVFNPDTRHGMFWSESMPDEIRARHGLEEAAVHLPEPTPAPGSPAPVAETAKTPSPPRVALRVIEGDGSADHPPGSAAVKRPRPKLRLVD
ncbi:MAG: hypothetical protein HQL98_02355 [Magnetococcales bacterium]|nr:hypothetical protein [Magnetococcales bacterium]